MLDRLDLLVLAGSAPRAGSAASTPATSSRELAGVSTRPVVPASVSTFAPRGPRFVDYMACPLCTAVRVGITYQGELRDGSKVYELYAHSPDRATVARGVPRCLGAGLRVVFVGGVWKGTTR